MQLTFIGATGTVTGSKYLLSCQAKKILIDCGLFQGQQELRARNWLPLPIAPSALDAVIITHAHIDHTGYIPLLCKNGFKGKIFATPGTRALCEILLPDSGYLLEEEAKLANRYGYSKHKPALPLYTQEEAQQALNQFESVDFNCPYALFADISFYFKRAGHIIGSALLTINQGDKSLVFTGDLGRPHDIVMHPPETIAQADYLVIESTYGNRQHDTLDPQNKIAAIINKTVARGGTVVVPAFAVGRTQNLLYHLYQLKQKAAIADVPIFLDSPMAINATEILCAYQHEHRLSTAECHGLHAIATYINTVENSKSLDIDKSPKIILSASGMIEGGRILHHIKAFAQDPNSTVLFTGFQAAGTRGAKILGGQRTVKIHGETITIHAEIAHIDNLSAHADAQELLDWCKHFRAPPHKTFIIHGEPNAANALKANLEKTLGWACIVPHYKQVEKL